MKTILMLTGLCGCLLATAQAQQTLEYEKDHKYGCITEQGNPLIPAEYERIICSSLEKYNFILAKKNGMWGSISVDNQIIIPFEYSNLELLDKQFLLAQKGTKWGIINTKGELHLPFEYEHIEQLHNNYVAAKKGGSYGVIDYASKVQKLPFEYDRIYPKGKVMEVSKKQKIGFFHVQKGELVTKVEYDLYSNLYGFQKGVGVVAIDGRYGLINENGQLITELKYDKIDMLNSNREYVLCEIKDKKGILSFSGKEIVPIEYTHISYYFKEDDLFEVVKGEKHGAFHFISKKEIVPCLYDEIHFSSNHQYAFAAKGDKWGVFDINGKNILPFEYQAIKNCHNDLFGVKKDNKWGFVNLKNKKVSDFIYDNIEYYLIERYKWSGIHNMVLVQQNGKWGAIGEKAEVIIPLSFDEPFVFWEDSDGITSTKKYGKYGCINMKGQEIIPFVYDNLSSFQKDGTAMVKKDGFYGIINRSNDVIIPFEYTLVGTHTEQWYGLDYFRGFVKVVKGDKCGVLNEKGKTVLPCEYQDLGFYYYNSEIGYANFFMVYYGTIGLKKDDKWGLIDREGVILIPFEYEHIYAPEGEISKLEKNGKFEYYNLKTRNFVKK